MPSGVYERKQKRRPIDYKRVFRTTRLMQPCWEVVSHKPTKRGRGGYIVLTAWGRHLSLHREMYRWAHGEILDGMMACHHCDNTRCCNPSHLYAGDAASNVADKMRRGRHRSLRGESNRSAKLTDQKVIEIYARVAAGESGAKLAREFEVNPSIICDITQGKTWRHLNLKPLPNRSRGESHRSAKLTAENVREIRARHSVGESCVQIARDFGVSRSAVSLIVRGKNWKHAQSPFETVAA
jgi:HNH endonuclease